MSPRARLYKTEAIVLRSMDLGEADRVLTVLTPRLGKLRVVLAFECPGNYLQALYPVTLVLPDIPVVIEARQ